MYTESKSLFDAVYSGNNQTEKRLKVELRSTRKSLNKKKQLEDCLTKNGALHEKFYDVLVGKGKLY